MGCKGRNTRNLLPTYSAIEDAHFKRAAHESDTHLRGLYSSYIPPKSKQKHTVFVSAHWLLIVKHNRCIHMIEPSNAHACNTRDKNSLNLNFKLFMYVEFLFPFLFLLCFSCIDSVHWPPAALLYYGAFCILHSFSCMCTYVDLVATVFSSPLQLEILQRREANKLWHLLLQSPGQHQQCLSFKETQHIKQTVTDVH